MTACAQLEKVLSEEPLTAELSKHVEGCETCAEARAAFETAATPLEAGVSARIRGPAIEELKRAPLPEPWWKDALRFSLLNVIAAGVGAWWVSWKHPAVAKSPWVWGVVAALCLLLILVGPFASFAPGGSAWRRRLLPSAVLAGFLVWIGRTGLPGVRPFWVSGWSCSRTELWLAALPAAIAVFGLTRFAFNWRRAWTAGLSAGAAGMLALHLHCPIGTTDHIVLFHLVPWVVVAALVVWVRWRAKSRTYAP